MLHSRHLICVRISGAALFVAVACWPGLSLAQANALPAESAPTAPAAVTAPAPDPVPPAAIAQWYGWQTLVSDLVSLTFVAGGIFVGASGSTAGALTLVGLGMSALWLAPPAIHLTHGNRWALGSLLIRTVAVGLVVGGTVATAACFGGGCGSAGPALLGTGLVALAGILVTDAVLGKERVEPPRVSLAPWGAPHARAGGLSLLASW